FSLLGFMGAEIYRQAPPIPLKFISPNNNVLMTSDDILDGQSAWQYIGGMELGSIWGHGSYQAPDWTADWLHRELLAWLELAAKEQYYKPYSDLSDSEKNVLRFELEKEYRTNTFDEDTGVVTISSRRALAI